MARFVTCSKCGQEMYFVSVEDNPDFDPEYDERQEWWECPNGHLELIAEDDILEEFDDEF